MNYFVRAIEPEDKDQFLRFLANWVGGSAVENRYKWLYERNPHGKALTSLAIETNSGRIIGCASSFPRKIWFENQIRLGACGGDTYVDPKFRRQGVAVALYGGLRRQLRNAGVKVHYGFPLDANLRALGKAGSNIPGDFVRTRVFLRGDGLIDKLRLGRKSSAWLSKLVNAVLAYQLRIRSLKCGRLEGSYKVLSEFDRRFDDLMKEILPSFKICVARDSSYLNWRYFEKPIKGQAVFGYEVQGVLVGYAVLVFSRKQVVLFDFFAKNEMKLVRNFIGFLLKLAANETSQQFISIINPSAIYSRAFADFGLRATKRATRAPLIAMPAEGDEYKEFTGVLERYYLTYGDTDLEGL